MADTLNEAGTVDEALRLASRAYSARDYKTCDQLLSDAAGMDPMSSDVALWQTRLAVRLERWQDVVTGARRVLASTPQHNEALRALAAAHTRRGEWPEAASAWQAVLNLQPNALDVMGELVTALSAVEDYVALVTLEQRLRQLGQEESEALLLAARLSSTVGVIAEGRDLYLELVPESREFLEQELANFLKLGALAHAASLMSALHAPDEPLSEDGHALSDALVRDGVHHERSGQPLEAYRCYAAASLLVPDDVVISSGMSRSLQRAYDMATAKATSGEFRPARQIAGALFAMKVLPGRTTRLLATIAEKEGKYAEAMHLWQEVVSVEADVESLLTLSRIAELANDPGRAVNAAKEALTRFPESKYPARTYHKLLSRLVHAARDLVLEQRNIEAVQLLRLIPEDAEQYADAQRRLAQAGKYLFVSMRNAYKNQQYEEVVRDGDIALPILPDNINAATLYAKSAMKLKRYADCIPVWTRLAAEAEDITPWLGLARCYVGLKQPDRARDALKEAEKRDPNDEGIPKIRAAVAKLET